MCIRDSNSIADNLAQKNCDLYNILSDVVSMDVSAIISPRLDEETFRTLDKKIVAEGEKTTLQAKRALFESTHHQHKCTDKIEVNKDRYVIADFIDFFIICGCAFLLSIITAVVSKLGIFLLGQNHLEQFISDEEKLFFDSFLGTCAVNLAFSIRRVREGHLNSKVTSANLNVLRIAYAAKLRRRKKLVLDSTTVKRHRSSIQKIAKFFVAETKTPYLRLMKVLISSRLIDESKMSGLIEKAMKISSAHKRILFQVSRMIGYSAAGAWVQAIQSELNRMNPFAKKSSGS
eukprot:TRINITY_DN10634_c0_g1_i1.p1 TRINITY_DN10634_c0_g1~~TRINITY_DN10634_c0_g1_i1.p1  ORF type:complete len:289 (+),score=33.53 TRINITY_DN10634_c0_g1_i1:65-931(+)